MSQSRPWQSSAHVRTRALAAIMLALAVLLGACGVATPRATETAPTATVPLPLATSTPAGPTATSTPDPAILLREGGIALIQTAYNKLLDEYIEPLEPQSLLSQAWYGVETEVAAEGLSLPTAPVFSGDREGDFAAFRAVYVPLAARASDASKLRYAAIKTMASSLNDCHTFFLIPVASESLNGTRQGVGSVGIGVELAGVPPLVTEVVAGGPAARVGVLVGDRITAIDGGDVSRLGPQGALDLINGTEGTTVGLRLRRAGQLDPVEVSIRRERVVPQNVESRPIGETGVGYVRVRNFVDAGIAAPIKDALTQFEATGITKWIIDLRGDPGGRMDAGAIGLFVPKGQVIERDRGRGGVTTDQTADGGTLPVIRPLVLLTNNRTGSVAEAFAAALQEYDVAYVVGEKTNGCVGFTDITPLADGSSIAVTTHVNLGPVSSKVLNGVGVIPDEVVPRTQADIANGDDPQLDAAVAHLRSR